MKSLNEILSVVQNSLGDIAQERVPQAEYVDTANLITNEVAGKTEIYLGRYITQPYAGCENWVDNKSYAIGAIVRDETDGNYYVCVGTIYQDVSNVSKKPSQDSQNLYWLKIREYDNSKTYQKNNYVYQGEPVQFWKAKKVNTGEVPGDYGNAAWEPIIISQPHTVTIPFTDPVTGQILSPYRILKITRSDKPAINTIGENTDINFRETREYSIQSVNASQAGNAPFVVNNLDMDNVGFGTHFMDANKKEVSDGRTIAFATKFEYGETVIVDFIQSEPFQMTAWFEYVYPSIIPNTNPYPPLDIPNFLYNAYRWGIQWQICERLYAAGDESFAPRADRARQYYDTYLREAMAYAQMLLDKNSFIQSQPRIWLP